MLGKVPEYLGFRKTQNDVKLKSRAAQMKLFSNKQDHLFGNDMLVCTDRNWQHSSIPMKLQHLYQKFYN